MTLLAETATLAWGYSMAEVERMTRRATYRSHAQMFDGRERWDIAWSAIVGALYESAEAPTWSELVIVGMRAINDAVRAENRHSGIDEKTLSETPSFSKYWLPIASVDHDDFTERIVETLALPQVLATLTGAEYDAIAALAAHGNHRAAAASLGIKAGAFATRVNTARAKISTVWLEGETPRRARRAQDDETCRSGHSRAEFGSKTPGGVWQCQVCRRNAARRRRARGARG